MKNKKAVLLYLGSPNVLKQIEDDYLNGITCQIFAASDEDKIAKIVAAHNPNIILVDIDRNYLEISKSILSNFTNIKVIGLTKASQMNRIVKAVKFGVDEVVHVETASSELRKIISRTVQQFEEINQGKRLHRKLQKQYNFSSIIGRSPEIQNLFQRLRKIIQRKWVTVLITGETGTGKELIAKAIHYNCFQQTHPFVEINCNVLPENLLESELFGYEKGAFTDAKTQKKGLFELAETGTLFLDEIGDISPAIQVKLLKALEEKKIRRLGGTRDIQIKTRIIAATNRNLQEAIKQGSFRNDLYYRLNVFTVHLPALRERGDDILLLAQHFLKHYANEYESPLRTFSHDAEALIRNYTWPGNVRELGHTIERIVLLGEENEVTQADVEEALQSNTPLILSEKKQSTDVVIEIPPEGLSLDDGEKMLIQAVLDKMRWNKRKTCAMLKISRPRLDRKITKYGLQPQSRRSNT